MIHGKWHGNFGQKHCLCHHKSNVKTNRCNLLKNPTEVFNAAVRQGLQLIIGPSTRSNGFTSRQTVDDLDPRIGTSERISDLWDHGQRCFIHNIGKITPCHVGKLFLSVFPLPHLGPEIWKLLTNLTGSSGHIRNLQSATLWEDAIRMPEKTLRPSCLTNLSSASPRNIFAWEGIEMSSEVSRTVWPILARSSLAWVLFWNFWEWLWILGSDELITHLTIAIVNVNMNLGFEGQCSFARFVFACMVTVMFGQFSHDLQSVIGRKPQTYRRYHIIG